MPQKIKSILPKEKEVGDWSVVCDNESCTAIGAYNLARREDYAKIPEIVEYVVGELKKVNLEKIAEDVEEEWKMGGLSHGLYFDYAKEIFNRAILQDSLQGNKE